MKVVHDHNTTLIIHAFSESTTRFSSEIFDVIDSVAAK